MSDLQISLVAVGALIVLCVLIFNEWQERQYRRRAERAFDREQDDVLLQRAEVPGLATREAGPAPRVEPTLLDESTAATPGAHDDGRPGVASAALVDPLIDYVVEINAQSPVESADLHQELQMLAAGWGKSVLASGCESGNGEWKVAGSGSATRYPRLRFAVQMSNRAGCIERTQLILFRDAVLAWAERNRAEATCPDIIEAHAMATQLDQFCTDVDIAIGINIVTADGNPFSGTKIRALAEAAGMKLESDGVFYAHGERGDMRFKLDNHEPVPFLPEQIKTLSTRGVTFLLDVPRVERAMQAFDMMLEMAGKFAVALDGTLVDDNRAALTDEAIARTRSRLQRILAKLEEGQIAAGGTRALRLFS